MLETREPLEFVQRFFGTYQIPSPKCDHGGWEEGGCTSRAIGMWQTSEHTGYCLCEFHRKQYGAPEMPENVWYAPTGLLNNGRYLNNDDDHTNNLQSTPSPQPHKDTN